MTDRSRSHEDDRTALALGRLLRGEREPRPGVDDSGLERLLRTAGESPMEDSPPTWPRWALVAAVAALAGALATLVWVRGDERALTFSTNGVPRQGPVTIEADAAHAVDLAFSDGTVFDVEPSARMRVESSSPTGARLTIVDGKTLAHVVHRPKASWSVAAGPFEVQVTGTRFGAKWDRTNARLSVELYEGSVQVVGGSFTSPIAVRAGQRLEAGTGPGNWILTSLDGPPRTASDAPAAAASTSAPTIAGSSVSASDSSAPAAPPEASSGVRAAGTRDWPTLLGRADFEGILKQADELGVDRCFSTCTPSDLRILADSARYLGRYTLAERSLLALRKRSPGEAANAAFLLARLEESRHPGQALSWYEKSLEEAPASAYAAEAWAGEMRLLMQSGGPAAAAPAAAKYLERFPNGVHATHAREILARAAPHGPRP